MCHMEGKKDAWRLGNWYYLPHNQKSDKLDCNNYRGITKYTLMSGYWAETWPHTAQSPETQELFDGNYPKTFHNFDTP